MKIISKNKNDTRREVIIDGKTRHIHFRDGKWWYCTDRVRNKYAEVKEAP